MHKNCFIILNYNDSQTTCTLLHHISNYSWLDHILVVDNCSTDGSYEELKKWEDSKFTVIRTERNGGYAYGNNYGAEYARKNWQPTVLFFSNPDVQVEENTVMTIEKTLFENSAYAVCAPLERDGYNVWDLPDYFGILRSLFLGLFTLHKHRLKSKIRKNGIVQNVGVVSGGLFAIKAVPFYEISGFDARTFLYLEENILSRKLKQHGYQVVVNPAATYIHAHSKSIKKEYKTKSNAFHLFYPGYEIYLKDYLKCGRLRFILFGILFKVAFWERKIWDIMNQHRGRD